MGSAAGVSSRTPMADITLRPAINSPLGDSELGSVVDRLSPCPPFASCESDIGRISESDWKDYPRNPSRGSHPNSRPSGAVETTSKVLENGLTSHHENNTRSHGGHCHTDWGGPRRRSPATRRSMSIGAFVPRFPATATSERKTVYDLPQEALLRLQGVESLLNVNGSFVAGSHP